MQPRRRAGADLRAEARRGTDTQTGRGREEEEEGVEGRKEDKLSPAGNSLPPELSRKRQEWLQPSEHWSGSPEAAFQPGLQSSRGPGPPSQAWVPQLPGDGHRKCSSESFCGSFQKVLWASLEAPGG